MKPSASDPIKFLVLDLGSRITGATPIEQSSILPKPTTKWYWPGTSMGMWACTSLPAGVWLRAQRPEQKPR